MSFCVGANMRGISRYGVWRVDAYIPRYAFKAVYTPKWHTTSIPSPKTLLRWSARGVRIYLTPKQSKYLESPSGPNQTWVATPFLFGVTNHFLIRVRRHDPNQPMGCHDAFFLGRVSCRDSRPEAPDAFWALKVGCCQGPLRGPRSGPGIWKGHEP